MKGLKKLCEAPAHWKIPLKFRSSPVSHSSPLQGLLSGVLSDLWTPGNTAQKCIRIEHLPRGKAHIIHQLSKSQITLCITLFGLAPSVHMTRPQTLPPWSKASCSLCLLLGSFPSCSPGLPSHCPLLETFFHFSFVKS